jgi:hypothetical protein
LTQTNSIDFIHQTEFASPVENFELLHVVGVIRPIEMEMSRGVGLVGSVVLFRLMDPLRPGIPIELSHVMDQLRQNQLLGAIEEIPSELYLLPIELSQHSPM